MSCCYRLSNPESGLPRREFQARLAEHGIQVADGQYSDRFQITDGSSYIWCHIAEGRVADFEVFVESRNDTRAMFDAIEEITGETVLSEHDEGFFEDDRLEDVEESMAGEEEQYH